MPSGSVISLDRYPMQRGQTFHRHVHPAHQLNWASSGVLTVEVDDRYWVLPTSLALWIPAGIPHATHATREAVLQGIYVEPAATPAIWDMLTVFGVPPLARQLIEHLTTEVGEPARGRAEAVLFDVLQPVAKAAIDVPVPADERARQVAQILLDDPRDQRTLDELGRAVQASPRTLLRLFHAETGLTFNQWRTHARLRAAMSQLADGEPVARVADRVGYTTASAFVAAFRRVTGHTPGAYFADTGALIASGNGGDDGFSHRDPL